MPSHRLLLISSLALSAAATTQAPSRELADAAAAYAAKVTASAIFVSGRTLDSVLAQEFEPTRPLEAMIKPLLRFDIDRDQRSVTCRLGPASATAIATAGIGCVLVRDGADIDVLRQRGTAPAANAGDATTPAPRPLPTAETDIDRAAVQRAIDAAFVEHDPKRPIHTRAVVVLHRGNVVGERYADGIARDMPLPGWSMTKTLTHALLGLRVADGKFDVDAPPAVPAWRAADSDGRDAIGVRDLLSMSAGLKWRENYDDPNSEVLRMLFGSSDHAAVYTAQPVIAAPGENFRYASGATNLLCKLLRQTFATDAEYWLFPQRLFDQLGMRTAVLEADPSGTFVGSSYCYASARDWARLGLLYAQNGAFDDHQVLPASWIANARKALPASDGRYGHQLWLNADPDGDGDRTRRWADLPADLCHMDGHEGQYCIVSPSAELVIVRLGCTKSGGFGLRRLLRDVHQALPTAAGSATGR